MELFIYKKAYIDKLMKRKKNLNFFKKYKPAYQLDHSKFINLNLYFCNSEFLLTFFKFVFFYTNIFFFFSLKTLKQIFIFFFSYNFVIKNYFTKSFIYSEPLKSFFSSLGYTLSDMTKPKSSDNIIMKNSFSVLNTAFLFQLFFFRLFFSFFFKYFILLNNVCYYISINLIHQVHEEE